MAALDRRTFLHASASAAALPASIPVEVRTARGGDDALVRLSVGIEEVEDLREDLR